MILLRLAVEQLLERRFRELSTPFRQKLDLTVVGYTPNDVSSLITFPGELFKSNTEPSLSVAEGKSLTEVLKGEKTIFTIMTKDNLQRNRPNKCLDHFQNKGDLENNHN